MLTREIISKVESFVSKCPRSVQELSEHLNKNWRTVDRYVKQIEEEFGTIRTKTFRGGTRGALKIVYWNIVENLHQSAFQERLEKEILNGKTKYDFSAFDIFQHVSQKNKNAILEKELSEETTNLKNLRNLIRDTKKELKIFSGDLSFVNFKQDKIDLFDALDNAVQRGVKLKIVCRVDIVGRNNILRILSLNNKYGKELVEIRHREQPLRSLISDNKVFRIKEIKEPTGKIKGLNKKFFIFYTIREKEWVEWLSKIFVRMFQDSIGADKRLREIDNIFRKR